MSRYHRIYDFLYRVLPAETEIFGLDLVGNSGRSGVFGYALAAVDYGYVFFRLATSKHKAFFVREYNNYMLYPLLLIAKIFRKRLYLNVNHNITTKADAKRLQKLCKRYKSQAVVFEERTATKEKPEWFFPIEMPAAPRCPNSVLKVGVLGSSRGEKKISSVLDFIASYKGAGALDKFQFYLGADADLREGENQIRYIEFVDTTLAESYTGLLAMVDVLILNYGQAYNYRTSGVIMDAVRSRTVVISPQYQLLENQITWPARVGVTFECLEELPGLLTLVQESLYNEVRHFDFDFDAYFEGRSIETLRNSLSNKV